MASNGTPVVFIHGLWLHATSWANWTELFRQAGYAAVAPSWPGIPDTVAEARARPDAMAAGGIDEIVAHYAGIIRELRSRPAVIGHSFGGLVAMKLLGMGLAAAAIAIDAAPIKGVLRLPLSSLRSSFPVLKNPANRHRAVPLTAAQFRWSFANAVSAEESEDLYRRWAIPAPGRPLWQAALANLTPSSPADVDKGDETRGPLLLTAGEKDRVVPPAVTHAILEQYRRSPAPTELRQFPERGHSLTVDSGWRQIADVSLSWLHQHMR